MYTERMRENFDPNTIEDDHVRQVIMTLMNMVENLTAKVQAQAEEIQRLRDENARLKGEQGKPHFKPKPSAHLLSSEQERHESKAHHKAKKHALIHIDRVETITIDPTCLPEDAQWKGYDDVIVQDVIFRTDTIRFRKEIYYSPSQKRTYRAELPQGYSGQFGPRVRAWVLTLYYASGMSQPKIATLLQTIGLHISTGQLSTFLITNQDLFHAESAAILQAGLASTPWQHLDSTGTGLCGKQSQCHILCNPWYTAYQTLPFKDRLSMLRVLQGGVDPVFQLNALAQTLLPLMGVSPKWCSLLPTFLSADQIYTELQLDTILEKHLPIYSIPLRKHIKEALAIATYRTQKTAPVVSLLLCDDAPQFTWLTDQLALCWVHEYRLYKKLMPQLWMHCDILKRFADGFWALYRDLQAYRDHPTPSAAAALHLAFDQLFGQHSGYDQLDERLALTRAKKASLLMVLSHPEILLHNNPAELAARQRVRKRDVSLQTCTTQGLHAWDTFQTLVETASKLGVNVYQYIYDRLTFTNLLPSLSSLIQERSASVSHSNSWSLST
jgi:Transposase IS66 family